MTVLLRSQLAPFCFSAARRHRLVTVAIAALLLFDVGHAKAGIYLCIEGDGRRLLKDVGGPGCKSLEIPKRPKLTLDEARAELVRDLNDPESARFRDIRFDSELSVMCGQMNVKNQSGGYTGYRDFAIVLDDGLSNAARGAHRLASQPNPGPKRSACRF